MKNEYLKKLKLSIDPVLASANHFKKDLINAVKPASNEFKRDIIQGLSDGTKTFTDALEHVFTNAIKDMKSMLELSQLSNRETRELAFGYGFSASEAFGWKKALEAVGLSGEEDLFYANQQELRQFREAFTKYSQKYDELYDSGFFETMQDYQYEMQDFKNEMSLEVAQFFMDNKDTIKGAMKAMMWTADAIMTIIDFLKRLFKNPTSTNVATSADIINQYSTSSNKNVNVNNTNNFTNVSAENKPWIEDMMNMNYEQLIQSLGGDA